MRNRTIRSVLARRPMFANGGMLPPVTQSPMASGILGSSTPLIETVNNQQSPDSGVRVSMANGGVARLQGGGVPSLSIRPLPPGSPGLGSYSEPYELASETLSNLVNKDLRLNRIFPKWRNPGGRSWEQAGFGPKGSRAERALHEAASTVRDFGSSIADMGGAVGEWAFSGEAREKGYSPSQILSINKMKELRPNLADDIDQISEKIIVEEGSDIGGESLAQEVAYRLSMKHENLGSLPGSDFVDAEIAFGPEEGPFAEIKAKYPKMPDDMAAEVRVLMEDNPGTDIETIVNASYPPDLIEEFGVKVTAAEEPEALTTKIEPEVKPEEGEVKPEEGEVKPEEGEGPPEVVTVEPPEEGEDVAVTREKEIKALSDEAEAEAGTGEQMGYQAELVRQSAEKGDTSETKRELKDYMDEFKKAVPGYKGMTESEKGFTIMEAGLKVMAGQSSNAITNIAEGLKGVSKEFVADKKARRAFDQQIDLSAAKYGLENVAKDRTAALALAKEGRKMPYKLIATKDFTFDGKKITKGMAFPLTRAQIDQGLLQKLPLTYDSTYISDAKATLANTKAALKNRIGPQQFMATQEKYLDNLQRFKSGVRMKSVLRESARLAADGKILGISSFFQDAANKAMNTIGIQKKDRGEFLKKYSTTDRESYSAKQKRLGTLMATELLREGSKTLSDYDRKRVEELIGALSGTESVWASEEVLKDRLINLELSLDEGINRSANYLKGAETIWRREVTKGGTAIGPVLLEMRRRGLGETTGLKGVGKNYLLSDIYDIGSKKFKPAFLGRSK